MQLCDDHIIFNERTFLWKQSRVVPLPVLDLSQELQFVLETSACPCVTVLCANLPFMVELNPRMWNVPLPKTEFLPEGLCWKWRKKIKGGQGGQTEWNTSFLVGSQTKVCEPVLKWRCYQFKWIWIKCFWLFCQQDSERLSAFVHCDYRSLTFIASFHPTAFTHFPECSHNTALHQKWSSDNTADVQQSRGEQLPFEPVL